MQLQLANSLPLEQALVVHLSPLMLGVVCILCPIILSVVGLLLTRRIVPSHSLRKHHDIAGPFFNTLGAVYGIFLAFVVTNTWQFYSTTGSNLVQEARCLEDLHTNANAYPHPFRSEIQKLLKEYRDSVVQSEWESLKHGKPSRETALLLARIDEAYASHKVADAAEAAFFHESIKSLNTMESLRASRIAGSASGLIPFLWCVLLAGGVATICFAFLFGAEDFTTHAVMTALLTGVICLILYTIVNLDFPFSGMVSMDATPLQRLQLE